MNAKPYLRQVLGPALTLLVGILLMMLDRYGTPIPNGDNLLFIAVTFSGFYGGLASGVIATAVVYALYLLTILSPAPPLVDELNAISIFITLPILGVMAGLFRRRLDRVRVKEGEYQTIVDNVDAVFFLADAKANRYFYVSSAYEKVWGRPVADLYKDPSDWLKAVDPEDLTWLKKDLGEDFAGVFTEIPGQKPFRIRRPDGTVKWVSSLVVSIKGRSGKVERVAGILQDRTKEVEALRGLELQGERFRKLVENSWDATVITKIDGTQTYVSPATERIFGYPAGEFIRTNVFSNVHPDDLPVAKSAAEELVKSPEKAVIVQVRAQHKDGTWRWIEAVMTNKIGVVGIDGVIMNLRDVTARKDAALDMAEKEERLRQIVDNINDVFFIVAKDFSKTYYISPAYENIWGHKVAELYADPKSWSETIVPEDRDPVLASLQKTFAAGRAEEAALPLFRIVRPDGTMRWIEAMITPLENENGPTDRFVGVARDITEQVTSLENLKASESHYRTLFGSMLNGLAYCKMLFADGKPSDFTYLEVNEAFERQTGLKGAKGKKASDVMPGIQESDPDLIATYGRVALSGRPESFEVYVNALKQWFSVSTYSPEKGYFVAIFDVITERKNTEARLKNLNELKNKFITTVSHQLRTPLSVVRWNLETILAEDLGKIKKEQRAFLHVTHDANGEVITRINDFLLALDIEESRVHVTKETVSIEALCRVIMTNAMKRCEMKGLTCTFATAKGKVPLVLADADKLRVVIEKLVDNAVLYTPKGSIVVRLSSAAGKVRFEIADTGIGIPKDEQPSIYHRFFRGSNALLIKTDASGLGLYIAKHYIEAHGGTIGFESEEGGGSTFWFEIPLK